MARTRRTEMRKSCFTSTALVAALVLVGALAPLPAPAQQPGAADHHDQPAPPKPYKPVAIKLPQEMKDQSFQTFRKQLTTIAQKKDRAALARIIAQNFFWVPDDKDVADKRKSGIDNLSKAIGLEGRDPAGWEILAGFAGETTADPSPDHKGAICAPGEPAFDEK